jgi:hypothetical protein
LPGWINLDSSPNSGADLTFDLAACGDRRLPIPDDHIDGFLMIQGFEQIGSIRTLMRRLYRVAKPGARFIARMPPGFFRDRWRRYLKKQAGMKPDWQTTRLKFVADERELVPEGDDASQRRSGAAARGAGEVLVEMRAVKPGRPMDMRAGDRPRRTTTHSPVDRKSDFRMRLQADRAGADD